MWIGVGIALTMAIAWLCQPRTGESERPSARDENELFHNPPELAENS
jgi:hypothetical protein